MPKDYLLVYLMFNKYLLFDKCTVLRLWVQFCTKQIMILYNLSKLASITFLLYFCSVIQVFCDEVVRTKEKSHFSWLVFIAKWERT
jgi:hypothetical protein